ncbi:MAG: hypothetical protein GXX09_00320 [Syntrophomonadaceae bacterium]|nr:hypothetical protein [Syntrophomonadaceae bacterium]
MNMVRKNLGMGLDILLSAAGTPAARAAENALLTRARSIYDLALKEDEMGNAWEAYHHYRQVIDLFGNPQTASAEARALISQALNNAAVILFENNHPEAARCLLERAVAVCPENATARANLGMIRS